MKEKYIALFYKNNKNTYEGIIHSDVYYDQSVIFNTKEIWLDSDDLRTVTRYVALLSGEELYFGTYEPTRISNADVVFVGVYKYNKETLKLDVLDTPYIQDTYLL